MTNERRVSSSRRSKSPASSQRSSSPVAEKHQDTPSVNSVEDPDYEDSPEPHDGSSSQQSIKEVRRLPSISKAWQAESPSDICLCQPDPKVPRPRNAFILYRQHYQAAVVAQNPGLANPEISKVIGEQWRDSPPDVKKHWKSLADEEKLRHQKQHPNYRYQPRRAGRSNSITSTQAGTSPGELPRCTKCGRRAITTPTSIPSTSTSTEDRAATTPFTPSGPMTSHTVPRYIRTLGSPGLNGPPSLNYRHPDQRQYPTQAHSLPSPHLKRPSALGGPQSPTDGKRRRLGFQGNYTPVHLPNGPATPFPYRRDSLVPLNHMNVAPHPSKSGFAMAPPPRPQPSPHVDPSLTLPPIQTHLATLRDHDSGASSQAKSLQAMIMSISPLNKIRVLAKISPPLAAPGPLSPKHATRGIAIAIDGQDEAAVKAITACLIKELSPSNTVRVFELEDEAGKKKKGSKSIEPGEIHDSNTNNNTIENDEAKTYDAYLSLTRRYHALSSSIISFITTPPTTTQTTISPHQPLDPDDDSDSPISPKTIPKPKTRTQYHLRKTSTQKPTTTTPPSQLEPGEGGEEKVKGTPIALLPHYALTHADRYACSLPITDAYAPIDHWQWMATLWRGIVGPDITIAVRSSVTPVETPTTAEMMAGKMVGGGAVPGVVRSAGVGGSGSGGVMGGGSGGKGAAVPVGQAVDVRLEDARAIVIRAGERGGVPEGGLRRVGFEVGEWVRGRGEGRRES